MVNVRRWLLPLLAIIVGLPMTAMSQASGYSFSTSSGTYDTLVGGTPVSGVVADSYISSAIPIGFTFNFNGVDYTDVYASSNGFLSFNSSSSNATLNDLSNNSTSSSMPLVAPLWDDLAGDAVSNSEASYQVSGTAPNRVFTFEWKRWEWTYSTSDPVISFQAKLYESTNAVEFHYAQEPEPVYSSASASIGLADGITFLSVQDVANPTVSYTVESDTISQKPATGTVYSFTPPSCFGPNGLDTYNVTGTSASLLWSGTGQTQWEYEYGPEGYALGSGTSALASNDTVSISGLFALTDYDFYVRNICGPGDTSAWVGPYTFTTDCGVILPAYSQGFSSWMPNCWFQATGGSVSTGPGTLGSSDWTYDYYLNDFWSFDNAANINLYSTGAQEWLISPEFDFSGGDYQLEFDFGITEYDDVGAEDMGSDDTVHVLITNDNGATWNVLQTWTQGSNYSNTGSHQTIYLNAYSGDTVQIAFRATDGSVSDFEDYDVFIDNFELTQMASCLAPTNLDAYYVSSDSAAISWDSNFTASQFIVEYGLSGFTQGTGSLDTISSDTAFLTGLSSSTAYDFYVRSYCGAGDSSTWSSISFVTNCLAYTANYLENFDNTSDGSMPACWSRYYSSGTSFWDEVNVYSYSGSTSSPNALLLYNDYTFSSSEFIMAVSPEFSDLTSNANRVRFNVVNPYSSLIVGTMSDPTDQATFVPVDTILDGNNSMTEFTVDLNNVTAGHSYVALRHSLEDYYDVIYVDDFSYEAIPSCLKPTAPVALSTTDNSATLSWTPGQGETEWVVEYDTIGFVQGAGNYVVVTNDTATITGLNAATNYEFYVRAVCTAGDSSYWSSTSATAVTGCGTIYAAPYLETFDGSEWVSGSSSDNSGDEIDLCWGRNPSSGFFFGTRTGTTSSSTTGPSGDNTSGSGNYMYTEGSNGSTGDMASLTSPRIDLNGMSYPTLDFAYHMYGSNIQTLYVQIDNGNGWVVLDSIVGSQQSSSSDAWAHKEVYLTGYSTDTVQLRWVTEKGSSYYNDVAIDDVEIFNTTGDDISAVAFIQPATLCGDSNTPIQVVVQNLGANAQTGFDVVVDWTGSTTGTISTTYAGTLNSNELDTIAVDTLNTFFGGTFDLTAYTMLSGDQDINNDSVNSGTVTILPGINAPTVTGSTSQFACTGTSVDFVATGGGDTIFWYDASGSVFASGDTVSVTATSGVDTLYATSMYNSTPSCESSPVMVTLTPDSIAVDLGADTAYCNGNGFAITLDAANAGSTYAWSTTETTQTILVDTAGSYSVEVTNANGCIAADTLVVSEIAAPIVDLGIDTGYCSDEAFALTLDAANAGSTYSWNTTETTQTISVDTAGSYSVVVTDVNGCSETDTLTVVENEAPSISIADAEFCEGDSETLDAGSGFASYAWSSTETTQTIVVDASGTYEVTVTDANGCTGEATSTVVVNPLPVVDLGADTGVSPGQVIVLDAGNAGSTYNWNTGETTQTIDVEYADSPAEFSVVVTDANGCSAGDTIYVDQNTGIDELVNGSVKVYPNPTRSNATITIDAVVSGELDVQMYSLTGQQIRNFKQDIYTGYQEVNVDMNNLESGVYFINATLNGKSLGQIRVLKVD